MTANDIKHYAFVNNEKHQNIIIPLFFQMNYYPFEKESDQTYDSPEQKKTKVVDENA